LFFNSLPTNELPVQITMTLFYQRAAFSCEMLSCGVLKQALYRV